MSNIRSTNVVRVTYDQIGCDNISISIIVTVASDIYLMNRGLDLSLLTIKAIESNRIMLQFFQREREREREKDELSAGLSHPFLLFIGSRIGETNSAIESQSFVVNETVYGLRSWLKFVS